MSITKNHQSTETLHALAAAAFPEKQVRDITELNEGMFNAAYRIDFMDGTASILKIAAADTSGLLTNEINLMQAEVSTMKLLHGRGVAYVPEVLFSDFTRTRCSGTYFFMEVMPGCSLNSCRSELSEETISGVMREVGCLERVTADIHRDRFGLAGDERQWDTLHELVRYMLTNVVQDAARAHVALGFGLDALLQRLERDRVCFDEVAVPSLVHMDLWEGNIFVDEGRLSGVIDWERALWGDPFMDDRFRMQSQHPAFLEGFGKTSFTPSEIRRIRWYDLYLYTTMLTECDYRQYEDCEGMKAWLRGLLEQLWRELERPVQGEGN